MLAIAFLFVRLEAAEFESLREALVATLGTSQALKKTVQVEGQTVEVYLPKAGGPRRAVVQKGVYPPNCTHTWVVGSTDSKTISEIRVVEMSCPHAFPCRSPGFLKQYLGKGLSSLPKLDRQVQSVAKATGSSELTTQAVRRTILALDLLGSQS